MQEVSRILNFNKLLDCKDFSREDEKQFINILKNQGYSAKYRKTTGSSERILKFTPLNLEKEIFCIRVDSSDFKEKKIESYKEIMLALLFTKRDRIKTFSYLSKKLGLQISDNVKEPHRIFKVQMPQFKLDVKITNQSLNDLNINLLFDYFKEQIK